MKPDQHKRAQSKKYQKANPEAAAVAAERRSKRGGKEAAAPTAVADEREEWKERKALTGNAFRYDDDNTLTPQEGGGADDGDMGADLEVMLAELEGTDGSVSHFRFAAETAWDPVSLVAQAGVVGATDSHAAKPTRSAIWPDMAVLARELEAVPLHVKLGLAPTELVYGSSNPNATGHEAAIATAEHPMAAPTLGEDGIAAASASKPMPVVNDVHNSESTKNSSSVSKDSDDDLEDWLDSVL